MITRVQKSSWNAKDNIGQVNLLDYSNLVTAGNNWTAALQAAIIDTQGGTYDIYIPGGTYNISPIVIPDNIIIRGVGSLRLANGSVGPLLTLGNGCRLFGIKLLGNQTLVTGGQWAPVFISNKSNIVISGVTITNARSSAIIITDAASDIMILDVTIASFTENGILISSGSNITISNCRISTVLIAMVPGNGIALISNGNPITNVTISNTRIVGVSGDGVAITGVGTRNVTDVVLTNCQVLGSTLSGFRATFSDRVVFSGCLAKNNLVAGFRLRGDVQNTRVSSSSAVGNTGVGIEEVNSGTSPNFNIFGMNVCSGNGNNNIIKLGANSIII